MNRKSPPPRVLLIAEGDSWGGIETHLVNLAPEFVDETNYQFRVLLFSEGRLSAALRQAGMTVDVIEKRGALSTLRRLRRYFRANPFDLLHMHSLVAAFYAVLATLGMRGRPCLLWTIHGKAERLLGASWIKDKIARSVVYPAIRIMNAFRVICVSDEIRTWVQERYGLQQSKLEIVRNGMSLSITPRDRKAFRMSLGYGDNNILLVMVGRLVEVKGHEDALLAVRDLLADYPDRIRLLVIGDGPLRDRLESRVLDLNLQRHVRFLGARADVQDLVGMADLFLMPSREEGIPYSLLEAMLLEKPVIASNVGGIPEVIQDRIEGVLVEKCSPKEIAAAVRLLISDKTLAKQLAVNARKAAAANFSARTMAVSTLRQYQCCLAERGAARNS